MDSQDFISVWVRSPPSSEPESDFLPAEAAAFVLQFKGALAAGVVHAAGDRVLVDVEGLQLVLLQRIHARWRERVQIVGRRQGTAAVRLRVDEIAAKWVLF